MAAFQDGQHSSLLTILQVRSEYDRFGEKAVSVRGGLCRRDGDISVGVQRKGYPQRPSMY